MAVSGTRWRRPMNPGVPMQRTLHSINGNSQKLDGGAMFGNAPRALWERWVTPDERNRIDLACRALLVREPDRNILFETGIGAFFDPRMKDRFGVQESEHVLLDNLEAIGLRHEDIDVVVLSHLHFDHAGGLLTAWEEGKALELLFPNATFIVSRPAWERALAPHPRDRASFVPELHVLLEASGRLELVDPGTTSPTLGPSTASTSPVATRPTHARRDSRSTGPVVFGGDLVPGRAGCIARSRWGTTGSLNYSSTRRAPVRGSRHSRRQTLLHPRPRLCAGPDHQDERGRFGSVQHKASLDGRSKPSPLRQAAQISGSDSMRT